MRDISPTQSPSRSCLSASEADSKDQPSANKSHRLGSSLPHLIGFRGNGFRTAWVLPVSPTCLSNGQGSAKCLAFRPTDAAFEPSLHQRQSPPPGNAIFQSRDKDPKTVPAIQSADCRDKRRAQIAANSGRFALNWEISVCAGLRGGGCSRFLTGLCLPNSLLTGKLTGNFGNFAP